MNIGYLIIHIYNEIISVPYEFFASRIGRKYNYSQHPPANALVSRLLLNIELIVLKTDFVFRVT